MSAADTRPERSNLARIRKGNTDLVVVAVCSFRGHRYCDVRSFYIKGEDEGPTAKGVTVPLDQLEELRDGIEAAIALRDGAQ